MNGSCVQDADPCEGYTATASDVTSAGYSTSKCLQCPHRNSVNYGKFDITTCKKTCKSPRVLCKGECVLCLHGDAVDKDTCKCVSQNVQEDSNKQTTTGTGTGGGGGGNSGSGPEYLSHRKNDEVKGRENLDNVW